VNDGGPQRLNPDTSLALALRLALEALDERADIARWMLSDHVAHGIIDSDVLQGRLRADVDAGAVLRASFALGQPPAG
jgi:hypothetical protein